MITPQQTANDGEIDRLIGDEWIPETDEPPFSLRMLVRHRLAGGW